MDVDTRERFVALNEGYLKLGQEFVLGLKVVTGAAGSFSSIELRLGPGVQEGEEPALTIANAAGNINLIDADKKIVASEILLPGDQALNVPIALLGANLIHRLYEQVRTQIGEKLMSAHLDKPFTADEIDTINVTLSGAYKTDVTSVFATPLAGNGTESVSALPDMVDRSDF